MSDLTPNSLFFLSPGFLLNIFKSAGAGGISGIFVPTLPAGLARPVRLNQDFTSLIENISVSVPPVRRRFPWRSGPEFHAFPTFSRHVPFPDFLGGRPFEPSQAAEASRPLSRFSTPEMVQNQPAGTHR